MKTTDLTSDQWAMLAQRAFVLGYRHGFLHSGEGPWTGQELAATLLNGIERRVIDRRKIRQVYGAGFDLGKSL